MNLRNPHDLVILMRQETTVNYLKELEVKPLTFKIYIFLVMVLVIDVDEEQKPLSAQLQQMDKEFFTFQDFCGLGLLNWLSLSSVASAFLNLNFYCWLLFSRTFYGSVLLDLL